MAVDGFWVADRSRKLVYRIEDDNARTLA